MQIPKRKPGKFAHLEPDRFVTAEKLQRLKDELKDLKERQLRPAADEVRRTSEMGDRSENAAYTEARARLTRLHNRILSVEERIRQAMVIPKGAGPGGTVRMGATVTLEVNGKRKTYEVLGAQEADPTRGRISHLSPLGKALTGMAAGDTVRVEANGRETVYRIVEVR